MTAPHPDAPHSDASPQEPETAAALSLFAAAAAAAVWHLLTDTTLSAALIALVVL